QSPRRSRGPEVLLHAPRTGLLLSAFDPHGTVPADGSVRARPGATVPQASRYLLLLLVCARAVLARTPYRTCLCFIFSLVGAGLWRDGRSVSGDHPPNVSCRVHQVARDRVTALAAVGVRHGPLRSRRGNFAGTGRRVVGRFHGTEGRGAAAQGAARTATSD